KPARSAPRAHRSNVTCVSRCTARPSSTFRGHPQRSRQNAPRLSSSMTGYLGMDLPRFLGIVRARKWLIVAIVVAAGALALAASLTQSNRYQASADLVFGKTTNADA